MARAQGHLQKVGQSPGRGAQLPASEREQLLKEARAALTQLPQEVRDLQQATKNFGSGFDRSKFVKAFDKRREDAASAALVNQLLWPLNSLVNQVNIVLANSTVLIGLCDHMAAKSMPNVHRALLAANVIKPGQARNLGILNNGRNALQHRYRLVTDANQVYDAAKVAAKVVKTFGQDDSNLLLQAGVIKKR